LKEENLILSETRTIMEKQLNDYQVRLLVMQRTDSDLNKYKNEVDDLLNQRELDKRRLCELCEKNAKLELDMKNLLNQNVNLDEELNHYKQQYQFMLGKHEQMVQSAQQSTQCQLTQIIETNKLKLSEYEHMNNELSLQLKMRDQDLSKLKENLRVKEINLDECLAKIKVLNDELKSEHENRVKCEKTLEQHKLEIRDLQVKLDDCVSETKKLDVSIREAAFSSELKESENQENFKKIIDSHEQLNESYKKLIIDHEQLQKIYLQMELDYEELYGELSKTHSEMNGVQVELDETKEKYRQSVNAIDSLEQRLSVFESRRFSDVSVNTTETLDDLIERKQLEQFYEHKFNELNNEINELARKRDTAESKVIALSKDLDLVKAENVTLKDENKKWGLDLVKFKEQTQIQSMQLTQLSEKIHTLETLNEKLEDEKSQLFEQLHLMLQQNQEILTQTLNNKDMYHEETKAYLLQLNNLKRQKEILEQKIMEQYKSCPSSNTKPKNKKSSSNNNSSNQSSTSNNNNNSQNSSQNMNTSTNSNNNNGGILDMFSKTRQFVQKVRNKSASSSLNTSANNATITNGNQHAQEPSTPAHILNDDSDLLPHSTQISYDPSAYSHKYAPDDIHFMNSRELTNALHANANYMNHMAHVNNNINRSQPQPSINTANKAVLCANNNVSSSTPKSNCLSSSLSSSSSSSSSSSCVLTNESKEPLEKTPVKLDPKSLKLGGRGVANASPSNGSSPSVVKIKHLNEYGRPQVLSQSPRSAGLPSSHSQPFISTNACSSTSSAAFTNQSPSSASTSSCSSTSSGVSSASLNPPSIAKQQLNVTPQKPIQSVAPNLLKSPITGIVTKSPHSMNLLAKSPSIHTIGGSSTSSSNSSCTPPRLNVPGKTKITAKIADSLNKYRLSADLDAHYEHQVRLSHSNGDEEALSEDSDESEMELNFANLKVNGKSLVKTAKAKVASQGGVSNSASFSAGKTPSNEIWLEYGCI
jgi:hypothetical protein